MNCTERYYPQWSSRGVRGVDCTRPAKAILMDFDRWGQRTVCGIHAARYRRLGATVVPLAEEPS